MDETFDARINRQLYLLVDCNNSKLVFSVMSIISNLTARILKYAAAMHMILCSMVMLYSVSL